MSRSPKTPYIPVQDLNEVLFQCEDAGYITGAARQRILEEVNERTRTLIVKSCEEKAANIMMQRCRQEAGALYRAQISAISRQRKTAHTDYDACNRSAYLDYEEKVALSKKDFIVLESQTRRKMEQLEIQLAPMPYGSEERAQTATAISTLRGRVSDLKRDKEISLDAIIGDYRHRCDRIKADYHARLCDLSIRARECLDEREENLNRIRAAKPEELAAIAEEIHGKMVEVAAGTDGAPAEAIGEEGGDA